MNINNPKRNTKLKMLPLNKYKGGDGSDPIRYYYWPVLGSLYRKRVEMCLSECQGGERILEVGFGSGISFLNLKDLYSEIYGIDLTTDIHQVETEFSNLDIPLNLQNGNVLHLNFQDMFFDTVLLISILEHLKPSELIKHLQKFIECSNQVGRSCLAHLLNASLW